MTPDSPNSSNEPLSTTNVSPTSFLHLPRELQDDIFARACYIEKPLVELDLRLAKNLTLVCKDLHLVAAALLYRNVMVTRPSILAELIRTLDAKPELGAIVKRLHLGSQRTLRASWWPMEATLFGLRGFPAGSLFIATSIRDETLLPTWCPTHRNLHLNDTKGISDHRTKALLAAIKAAQLFFDVDLKRPRYSVQGREMGSRAWLIGVMEIQAVIDLYLMEMRRLEDKAAHRVTPSEVGDSETEAPQPAKSSPIYPSLHLHATSTTSPGCGVSEQTFALTYTAVIDHLARRGATTDNFNHPLLLARSGVKVLDFDDAGLLTGSSEVLEQAGMLYEGGTFADRLNSSGPFSATEYRTSTAAGNLALARRLFALTPSIQELYISNFFQQLLCGTTLPQLPSLRMLSIGPLTLAHGDSIAPSVEHGSFSNLERLRINGYHFAGRKAAAVLGLAQLKRVDWETVWSKAPAEEIVEAMRPFFDALGLTQASAKHNDTQQNSTQHHTALIGASSSPSATQRDVPYVRLSMGMRNSCQRLLSAMFCDDARAALDGRRVCETPIALDLVMYGTFGGGPSEGEDEEARVVYCGLGEDWQESMQREGGVKRTWRRA